MGFEVFRSGKYLNLETFRRNGQGVKTPIWFAADPGKDLSTREAALYAYTVRNSGKVKRMRNSSRVRVAPCDIRGNLLGEWQEARAELISGAEGERADRLLNKKYWPWKQMLTFFASFRGRGRNGFVIRPA